MNNSIRNLIISSAMLGVIGAFCMNRKDNAKKQAKAKQGVDHSFENMFSERKYSKIADVYEDSENNIQLKKVI